jgi:hypothetical protein
LTSGTGAVLWTYGIYILFTHVWQIPAQCRVYCSIHNCSFFPQKKTVIFIQAFGTLLVPWFLSSFSMFQQGKALLLLLFCSLLWV